MGTLLVGEAVVGESHWLGPVVVLDQMVRLAVRGLRQLHSDRMLERSPKRELVGNCCMP